MFEHIGAKLLLVSLVALFGAIFAWGQRGISSADAEKAAHDFQVRLRDPKLEELKSKWGFLPAGFEKLYREQNLVLMRNVVLSKDDESKSFIVSTFFPADLATIRDFPTNNRGFPFAQAEFGKWYLVTLEPTKQRVVLFNSLFPDLLLEPIAESFEEFVRIPAKERHKE